MLQIMFENDDDVHAEYQGKSYFLHGLIRGTDISLRMMTMSRENVEDDELSDTLVFRLIRPCKCLWSSYLKYYTSSAIIANASS